MNPMIFSILFRCEIERTMSDEKINSKIVWDGVGGVIDKSSQIFMSPGINNYFEISMIYTGLNFFLIKMLLFIHN